MVLAAKLRLAPTHTGALLLAVGAAGVGLMVTEVIPAGLAGHPGTVAVTEYVPLAAVVTAAIVGFCIEAVYVFGPVHAYVALEIVLAVKIRVVPAQMVLLLVAVGAAGGGLTVAVVVPAGPAHPATVAVTE